MHILLLPSWYNTIDKPWRGTFFRDQAHSLIASGTRVGLAFVERRSLSGLTPANLIRQHFQTTLTDEDGIPTMRVKGWSTLAQTTAGSLLWSRLTRRLVHAYIAEHGVPDVIHGHAALWGGFAAMLCARDLGRPFVITEHSSSVLTLKLSNGEWRGAAEVYRNASAVLAVSDSLRRSVDRIAGAPVAEVVPNSVDPLFFALPPRCRGPRPFVFLAVGDLVAGKRIDLLLRAFARLQAPQSDARLVIVGAGRESRPLSRLARSLGAQGVEFTGALGRSMVRQRMWTANALVLPSECETFGVVLIEALSTGIPVIATRCGGPEEIVTPDLGILIERNDEDALLRAMQELLVRSFDPAKLHQSVRSRFAYDVVAPRLQAIYADVAQHRREVA